MHITKNQNHPSYSLMQSLSICTEENAYDNDDDDDDEWTTMMMMVMEKEEDWK